MSGIVRDAAGPSNRTGMEGRGRSGHSGALRNDLRWPVSAEIGPGRWGDICRRLSDDGWRCMYGKTHEEMMAGGGRHYL